MKKHYHWVVMFGCLLMMGAGSGIITSTLGALTRPVCQDLGFRRSEFALYFTITSLTQVVMMPVFGGLFNKFGFRRVAVISAIICGCSLLGYSISSTLWEFYLFSLLCGLFINGFTTMAVGIVMNDWFIDRRGFALGIAYCGSGLMSSIMIPASTSIALVIGWRWAYRFLGFVCLAVLLPIITLVIRNKPAEMGLVPYTDRKTSGITAATDTNYGLTRPEALKTRAFWFLMLACFGVTLCQGGAHTSTTTFLNDIGYSAVYAARISSAYMILLTVCKILMGFLFDKLGSLGGSLIIGTACILFPVAARFAELPGLPWLYAILLAIASSGGTVMSTILTTNCFGRKDFARIYSIISMAIYAGAAISTPALGLVFDLTGGYNAAWSILTLVGGCICLCLVFCDSSRRKQVLR